VCPRSNQGPIRDKRLEGNSGIERAKNYLGYGKTDDHAVLFAHNQAFHRRPGRDDAIRCDITIANILLKGNPYTFNDFRCKRWHANRSQNWGSTR
jgi:hypothetical protein